MKNLVIIPAGKTSEHQKWTEDHRDYGFDLCIQNFTKDFEFTDRNSTVAKYNIRKSGMKWGLAAEFLDNHPEWKDYDYILFMDDDLETTPSDIQKFFRICSEESFDLAQPGLCEGSTFTFYPTKKIPNAKYHLTNMVEIMVTCISKRMLLETLEDIRSSTNGIGWGLEGVWNIRFHVGNGKSKFSGKIGVVDDVNFCHKRPLGGTDSKIYELFGSPWKALADQEQRMGFKWSEMNFTTYSIEWKD